MFKQALVQRSNSASPRDAVFRHPVFGGTSNLLLVALSGPAVHQNGAMAPPGVALRGMEPNGASAEPLTSASAGHASQCHSRSRAGGAGVCLFPELPITYYIV
jgi:hypothetical protein